MTLFLDKYFCLYIGLGAGAKFFQFHYWVILTTSFKMLMVEKKKNPFSFSDPGPHLLHIQVEDNNEADLYSKFQTACTFIGKYNH